MADGTVTVDALVDRLLGCEWGRSVMHRDDMTPCEARAVQIVVLHDGPQERAYKLCARHSDRVFQETDARPDA